MKTITTIFIILFIAAGSSGVNSQSKLKESKFSIAVQGGTFIPTGNASDAYNTGFNAGIEAGYLIKKNIEIYLNANYNFIGYKSSLISSAAPSIFDASLGGRYYFGRSSSNKFFGEIGAGLYMFKTSSYDINTTVRTISNIDPKTGDTTYAYTTTTQTTPSSSSSNFGINAGFGDSYAMTLAEWRHRCRRPETLPS